MATSVNLGEQLEAFIGEAVRDGRYGSRSEVLREGVRLVQEREASWMRLDAELKRGLGDLDARRSEEVSAVADRLVRKYEGSLSKREA
ncbi:MAG TPA: type II toxin-antitoxin system ParD family antitoxin [Allosphingosinicella sp.]|nr:type II toxin-antitoxin system ParD family antitoxin [Allosphingosinicella sp.]